jgi:uncharacterized protein YjiS (DUF1127 family)
MSESVCDTYNVASRPSAFTRRSGQTRFLAFLPGLVENFLRWRRARATQDLLSRASDRTLRDIGVRRRDIVRGLPRADDEILEIDRRRLLK